jgi:hypothetical protein
VTVHRDNLSVNNQRDASSIQNFILSRNSTCFGHLLCPSSGFISCTRGNCYVSCRLCGRCLGESRWNCVIYTKVCMYVSPIFFVLSAVLLKIRFSYNVTTLRPVNTDVSKYRSAFIFRVKRLNLTVLDLLGPVRKGCASLRNVGYYLPVDHDYYRNSELQECIKKVSTLWSENPRKCIPITRKNRLSVLI